MTVNTNIQSIIFLGQSAIEVTNHSDPKTIPEENNAGGSAPQKEEPNRHASGAGIHISPAANKA